MAPSSKAPPKSDSAVFIMLMIVFAVMAGLSYAVLRVTLLPAVYRFLRRRQQEQQEQQQQELERQERLHDHLQQTRRDAELAAVDQALARRTLAAVSQHHQDQADWRDWMDELGRRFNRDEQAQNADANAQKEKVDHFRPAPGSLLYDSDDEDPEVVRGDKKAKKDK